MAVVAAVVAVVVGIAALFMFSGLTNSDDDLVNTPPPDSIAFVDSSLLDTTTPDTIENRASSVPITIAAPDSTTTTPMVTAVPTVTVTAPPVPTSGMPTTTGVPPGAPPLSADLRFTEDGTSTPFDVDPGRPGRFSVSIALRKSSVTPQVTARSGRSMSRDDSTTKQLEQCVVID